MLRDDLVSYLNDRLLIDTFQDVSVNGLQVEGKTEIQKVALAVDAALSVYEKAAAQDCDMIIAHHGMIWGGLSSVTGTVYAQLKFLLDRGINLYAAHLPLDAHTALGNNAQLAEAVALEDIVPFGKYHGRYLGFSGRLPEPCDAETLAKRFFDTVGGTPLVLPFGKSSIETVGIISGGGAGSLSEAAAEGIDCFVTGEGRHENHHFALEAKLNVIYLGHYHSETLGVRAVGRELEEKFGLSCIFIDEPTLL